MYDTDRVVFDEENQMRESSSFEFDETSSIVKFVIKNSGGLIKKKKQAYFVLYGFIIISLIITFSKILVKPNNNQMTDAQKIQIHKVEQMQILNR